MELILSTSGRAKPKYADFSSVEDIDVPKVEDIHYGKIMGDSAINRDYAHITMTPTQALGVALDILTKLHLDEGTIGNWSIQFPERENA